MKFSHLLLCALAFATACGVSSPEDRDSAAETSIAETALSTADPSVDPDALAVLGQAVLGACHGTVTCDPSSAYS